MRLPYTGDAIQVVVYPLLQTHAIFIRIQHGTLQTHLSTRGTPHGKTETFEENAFSFPDT